MWSNRAGRAFSLTELLVVIAVIVILLTILLIGMDATYDTALQLKCQHRLEQIGRACEMYGMQHHGVLPSSWDAYTGQLWYETLAKTTLGNWEVLGCPVAGDSPLASTGEGDLGDGSRENVDVLLSALNWLKDKQIKSGTYKGAWKRKTEGTTTGYFQGITGLALLTFMGFGCTDRHPPEFSENVKMAVEYLSSETAQYKSGDSIGGFKNNTSKTFYTQGLGLMALAGASRVCESPELRQKARAAAQLALNYMVARQPEHGAFGYYGTPTGGAYSDTSVCGWCYQGIAAARVSGLNVPGVAMERAAEFMTNVHDSYGRSTYWWTSPNGGGSWLAERHTAIALTARLLLGHGPQASDSQLQANWLMSGNRIINYQTGRAGGDLYGMYYVCLAMYRMGGTYWSKWYDFYPPQVMLKMIQDSPEMAHWPGEACGTSAQVGGGTDVGEVYATCMAALSLEAAFEEHWLDESWRPTGGGCSYGYNNRLGKSRLTPGGDTIIVMDYGHWQIDHDTVDVESNDDESLIALRHSGKANALLGDGRVVLLTVGQIFAGMWTPERGD